MLRLLITPVVRAEASSSTCKQLPRARSQVLQQVKRLLRELYDQDKSTETIGLAVERFYELDKVMH